MPTLARHIIEHDTTGVLNFQGFAVGNPFTDPVEYAKGHVDTLYGHSMVPRPAYLEWYDSCDGGNNVTDRCVDLTDSMQKWSGNINIYALSYPVCLGTNSSSSSTTRRFRPAQARLGCAAAESHPWLARALGLPSDPEEYEPCVDDFASAYLNRNDVKKAIHANARITWQECSGKTPYGTLMYNFTLHDVPVEPIYLELLASGKNLSILVFSGDDDSVCGTIGTQSWIWELGPKPVGDWKPWTSLDDGQVAGYVQHFDGLSFATVHGAGHEVPTFKPAQALQLISAYFNRSAWLMN